jgi:hypothetical protein
MWCSLTPKRNRLTYYRVLPALNEDVQTPQWRRGMWFSLHTWSMWIHLYLLKRAPTALVAKRAWYHHHHYALTHTTCCCSSASLVVSSSSSSWQRHASRAVLWCGGQGREFAVRRAGCRDRGNGWLSWRTFWPDTAAGATKTYCKHTNLPKNVL